jgi:hypothetical protein
MARQNRRVPLDMYCNKMVNGVPFLARSRNISREGLYLHRLLEPRAPDAAHIAVEFCLPGTTEVIWAEADIIHGAEREGHGLRFLHLTPRQSELIDGFVNDSSVPTCFG